MKNLTPKHLFLFLLFFAFLIPIALGSVSISAGVSNFSPAISVTPSDGGSSSASPTNVGSNVTFTATAKDVNSDQYYLAICKTNAVTPGANTYPTCDGGKWPAANPTAFNSDAGATETYAVQSTISQSNNWYAFVCDKVASGAACYPANAAGDQGRAAGLITFSGVPADAATLTIDSIIYEFDTANNGITGGRTEVDTSTSVNGSGAATKLALVEAGTSSSMLNRAPYVYVYADAAGAGGNSIGMAEAGDSGSAMTVSGANLTGGSATNSSPFFADFLTSIAITDSGGYTNDATPTITITKTGGTPTQIQFSCDGTNWSGNIAYQGDNTFNDSTADFNITSGATNCTATNALKTIYARLYDGTYGIAASDTTTYDTAAPTTGGAITAGTPGANSWYTTNVTYTLTPADNYSVASTVYCTDTANSCTPATPGTSVSVIAESATNYVRWFSTDTAGNVQTTQSSGIIKIDKTSPTISSTAPATSAYINSQVASYTLSETIASGTIAFTRTGGTADGSVHTCTFAAASLTSGAHTNIDLTNATNCTGWTALVNGSIYTVVFNATDPAGRTATAVTNTSVTYDTTPLVITSTAPATSANIRIQQVSYTYSEAASSGSIVFTRTSGATDAGSPHTCTLQGTARNTGAHTNLALATGANACVSWATSLVDGTVYTVVFNASDLSLNPATAITNTSVDYDTTAPTTSGAPTPASPNGSNSWYTTNVTYTLTPADAFSGVASTVYCVDTSGACVPGTSYTTALTLSTQSATNHVRWFSTDNAGNVQTTQDSGVIKIDTATPTTSGAPTPASPNGSNSWYKTNVTYTLTPADATSTVASTVYCTDTANSCTPGTPYVSAITLSTQSATNYVRWTSTDSAGNVQTTLSSGIIKIDTATPTTGGSITAGTPGANSWYTTDVTFTLVPADATSGVATTLYCTDTANSCSPVTPGTSVSVTTQSATNYVRWASTDSAGLTQTTQTSGIIKLDKTNPVISATAPATSSFLNTQTVSYTLSELAQSGTIVVTKTGGSPADAGSPHTCTLQGTALATGAHSGLTLSTGANTCVSWATNLVDGVVYSYAFNVTDPSGRAATAVTNTSVGYDTSGPTWSIQPTATATTTAAITANAGTLTDNLSGAPYNYYYDSYTTGACSVSATNSGWTAGTTWPFTGLATANFQYGFKVTGRDEISNSGTISNCVPKYTWANQPTTAGHSGQTPTNVRYTFAAPGTGVPVIYGYAYGTTTSCVEGTVTTATPYKDFTSTANTQIPLNYFCSINEDNIKNTTSPLAIGPFYTAANTPNPPTVGTPTATTLSVNPVTGGTETAMAIYVEVGAACDGSGGYYLAANGSNNGATAVWQTDAVWSTVVATNLTSGNQYSFCAKARNVDLDETAFSSPPSSAYPDRAPTFNVSFEPSDGGSTGSAPTNVGVNVTFTAKATDPEAQSYYLAVCKTNAITAGNNAAPTCASVPNTWAISGATSNNTVASVNYLTVIGNVESNAWYAFACDLNTTGLGACSAMSQGVANPSPFNVNHAPTFGTLLTGSAAGGTGSIIPGSTVYFHLNANGGANGIDDNDADTTQDTVRVYICDAATTSMATPGTCTGGTLICSQATPFNPNVTAFECSNATIAAVPKDHISYNFKTFVFDSHTFAGTGTTTQSYTIANVLPTVVSYTVNGLTPLTGVSVNYSFTVSINDGNGGGDVTSVQGLIYDDNIINLDINGVCTGNELNCYVRATPCTLGSPSGANVVATCDAIETFFNINPTTSPGVAIWKAHANPSDGNLVTTEADSNPFTVDALFALSTPTTSIDYGPLGVGALSSQATVTIQNAGNTVIDAGVYGTNLTSGANTIDRSQQHWSGSSGFNYASGNALVTSATNVSPATGCYNANVGVRATHLSGATDSTIYWLLLVPDTQVSGIYIGANEVGPITCL